MPAACVNGVKLHYDLSGAGDPLVLVHGSWVDHRSWEPVVGLLERSFRVLSYDRRGHSRLPGAARVRIQNADHVPHSSMPDRYVELVRRFASAETRIRGRALLT